MPDAPRRRGAALALGGLGRDLAAGLLLLALVAAFNPGLALFGQVLGGYDTFVYFYPLRSYIAEAAAQGRLPLWNPYLFAGTPYLANPQTAVFYPGTWLFAVMEVPRAYALSFLGHVWVAAVGLYAFARVSLGVGRPAAVLGGAAFAFSGFMNGQAGHVNQLGVAAWLPAVALALDLSLRTGRLLAVTGLVLGLLLQILAGHPQQLYMTVVVLGVLTVWRALAGPGDAPEAGNAPVARSAPVAGSAPEARNAPEAESAPGPGDAPEAERRSLQAGGRVPLPGGGPTWRLGRGVVLLGLAVGLAVGLAAVQLLPTLELSRYSIRGGGLSYEIAAFDALPWPLLLPALFPGYWAHLPTTEFFGHTSTVVVGLAWIGLLLGAGRPALLGAALVALGLVLAVGDATPLYRFLFDWAPGFASFRVPARWLMVSTLGIALLAALGTDRLVRWSGRGPAALRCLARRVGPLRAALAGVGLPLGLASLVVLGQPQSRWLLLVWGLLMLATVLLAGAVLLAPRLRVVALVLLLGGALADLWAAGLNLEHRQTIPDVAYGQLREGIAELRARAARHPGFRSLSIATPEYVVKDTAEYEERYGYLSPRALDNLLVTVKWNETLWPNVPLVHRLPSADGYDGGVLPLRTFHELTRAMLGPERARPDGVLASRLDALPEARWLDLLGVRWVLASRIKDETRGAVYFDRAVTATLRPGERLALTALPLGEFTALWLISSTTGPAVPGEPVGVVRLAGDGDAVAELPLRIGQETAPAGWPAERAPGLERVQRWSASGPDAPADWIAELSFARQPVRCLEIVNTSPTSTLQIGALNLVDDGRQMAFPITPDGRVERVDLFDLKLYDRQDALGRAYLVGSAAVLDDAEAARRLAEPSFEPRAGVVLAPSATASALAGGAGGAPGRVEIQLDQPERLRLLAVATADSYLVLSDSWYPGWRATVDGAEVPVERANILFRAVRLGPGEHVVELLYEPDSVRLGMLVSGLMGLVAVGGLAGAVLWRRRRERRDG